MTKLRTIYVAARVVVVELDEAPPHGWTISQIQVDEYPPITDAHGVYETEEQAVEEAQAIAKRLFGD